MSVESTSIILLSNRGKNGGGNRIKIYFQNPLAILGNFLRGFFGGSWGIAWEPSGFTGTLEPPQILYCIQNKMFSS